MILRPLSATVAIAVCLALWTPYRVRAQEAPRREPVMPVRDIHDLVVPPCESVVIRFCAQPRDVSPSAGAAGHGEEIPWQRRTSPWRTFAANVVAGIAEEQRSVSYAPGAMRPVDTSFAWQVVDFGLMGLMGPAGNARNSPQACGPDSRLNACSRP